MADIKKLRLLIIKSNLDCLNSLFGDEKQEEREKYFKLVMKDPFTWKTERHLLRWREVFKNTYIIEDRDIYKEVIRKRVTQYFEEENLI